MHCDDPQCEDCIRAREAYLNSLPRAKVPDLSKEKPGTYYIRPDGARVIRVSAVKRKRGRY